MKLSVVIPTFNGAWSVADAIDSVVSQSEQPYEIVVVDDCSSDGTCEVVDRLRRSSPIALRLIRLDANSGGPARPINVGVEACSAELIVVLDQDDVLAPSSLHWHLASLAALPEAAFSFTLAAYLKQPDRMLQFDFECEALGVAGQMHDGRLVIDGRDMLRLFLLGGNYVRGFPGFAFRRSAWSECGPIREQWRIGADLDFLCRLTGAGSAVFIPKVGYFRREHASNLCNDTVRMMSEVAEILIAHALRHANEELRYEVASTLRHRALEMSRELRQARIYWRGLKLCLSAGRLGGGRRDCAREALAIMAHWATHPRPKQRSGRDATRGSSSWYRTRS
jgi:glycosyltransferase involved in cell wall biosynthesis